MVAGEFEFVTQSDTRDAEALLSVTTEEAEALLFVTLLQLAAADNEDGVVDCGFALKCKSE